MDRVATIGFFDGMHVGHRYLLKTLLTIARQQHLAPLVVTFSQHPRAVLLPNDPPQLLMTSDERLHAIYEQGIDSVQVLNFSEVRTWTKRQFMHYLKHELGVEVLLMGYNHHFGCDGNADFAEYQREAEEEQLLLIQAQPYLYADRIVSSTVIRNLLLSRQLEVANAMLLTPYALSGKVVHGQQIGRSIGFPTANLLPTTSYKLIPATGVYAVEVLIEEVVYKGVLNIGTNPTVGGKTQTLEVYIQNFTGDLYDQTIVVRFLHFLREEQRFASLDELRRQILSDCRSAFC